jgi:alkylation response protein AidB-like acyl-CoA dehydrogenase
MTAAPLAAQETARRELGDWRGVLYGNSFDNDPVFARLLERLMGEGFPAAAKRLRAVAESSGPALDALVVESNRDENLPVLRRHDPLGRRVEEVVFHPAYHEAGRVFWRSGVLGVLQEPGHEVLSGAIAYLLDQQGEGGHACPVACTAGAIKLLQRLGTADQRERFLPGLLATDYDRRLHAAQFVTEVQGGSDVGANACVATPEPGRPGWYRIRGEKWFCSVADAGLFVVSARPEGAAEGTRGLGLFLVPRLVDGSPNGFALRRLKWKLGTRSMPTGEIEFDGALAEAIGPLDQGFKHLVGIVLDTSRAQNAVAACGIMRRAYREALSFAQRRRAFGQPIALYPAVLELLGRMRLRLTASLATTFRLLAVTDRLDTGDGDLDLAVARRIAVMINKYRTAVAATQTTRDAIEVLGGNGTIEDFSVLPRLYRDAIVVESWEGTHNTLCAQVLRDFVTRGLHRPWLALLESEIDRLGQGEVPSVAARARSFHSDMKSWIERMVRSDPDTAAAQVRHVVDRMCRLTEWVAMATQLAWERQRGIESSLGDTLELLNLTEIEPVDPMESVELRTLSARLGVEP